MLIRKAFPDSAEEGKYPSHALIGHRSPVLDIVFSPDGNTLASSSIDGSVGVWNLESLIAAKHYLRVDVTDGAMKFAGIEAVQPKVLRGTVGDAGTVAIDPTGLLLLTVDSAGPVGFGNCAISAPCRPRSPGSTEPRPLVSCGRLLAGAESGRRRTNGSQGLPAGHGHPDGHQWPPPRRWRRPLCLNPIMDRGQRQAGPNPALGGNRNRLGTAAASDTWLAQGPGL